MKVAIKAKLAILCFVLYLFINIWSAFNVAGKVKMLSEGRTQYIARFAVGKDSMLGVKARLRMASPETNGRKFNLKVLLMNDAEWDLALESDIWDERQRLARFNINISLDTGISMWTRLEMTKVKIINRPQVWYILLADCEGNFHKRNPELDYIEYEMEMTNDNSHFSHEYWGVLPSTMLSLTIFSYLLGKTSLKLLKETRKNNEYDTPIVPLLLAIGCELVYLSLSTMHLLIFWYDGYGIWLFDFLSTILGTLSQALIISLIIMIAHGWTLTFDSLHEHDYFIKELGLILGAHLILAVLTMVDDGEAHKYHDFSGIQGLILVSIRVALFIFFLVKVQQTMKIVPRRNLPFMKGFIVASSIYMLSFPLLWFISNPLNPHYRLKLIHFGNIFVQMIGVIILVNQITKKDTQYYKASTRSQGILPNNSKFE
jgi:hypothetical protein